ncbi:RluA family pseudouridine synthase [Desulfoprunum benzoelyticum]|uniref:tRNA pseudouridine32 synthase/23S rRNA pseudouridine746 synthase n=1 Tax=Desulfoprunum benzoelyticum TaxID=1506996 RepID=A0A840UPK5_9BACT|nr:RluA family pseudouridine synthase [Desulfoprunum benzoelyticum]MBB5346483.1 tRNA pseudouridine32 synthase/23S rRNA pseudouridine746 synthase [Desulfoprunum benzoelyticum]MBM9528988.1 RluA family pseudouridine synthase [Desulfoprunum benzoelyticum]
MANNPAPIIARLTVAETTATAPDLLAAATGLSKTAVKEAMAKGAVWLQRSGSKERRIRKAAVALRAGDHLALYYDPAILALAPPPPLLLAAERYYSVWYKPAGLLSQGSRFGDHCSLLRHAEKLKEIGAAARLLHRLDREARGLVLLAHGRSAAAALSRMFQTREIEKRYRAEIHGILGPVGEVMVCDAPLDGKTSRTVVTVQEICAERGTSRVDIVLETGRYHQIRRHLSSLGHPLVGDRRYGAGNDSAELQLVAWSLAFICPFTGRQRRYSLDNDGSANVLSCDPADRPGSLPRTRPRHLPTGSF